ncbi:hypothetical protein B4U80_12930 [Leptotrombidium deliense]|uniref:Sushi domain-containing protein n=1 Tax=Leptotrombidium deliense TaxID=299467 RepID=A0A443SH01_9ACAR|nr:hypothetical protein B4U80_12930 [Leptotrombidium deliense]
MSELLVTFLVFICFLTVVKSDCGIPAAPDGIEYKPDSLETIFKEGTKLTGSCNNETYKLVTIEKFQSYTFSESKRHIEIVCTDGSWKGSFARCAVPLAYLDESESKASKKSFIEKTTYYKGVVNTTEFLDGNLKDVIKTENFANTWASRPHCVERAEGLYLQGYSWVFEFKHKSTVSYVSLRLASSQNIDDEVISVEEPFVNVFINDIRECTMHSAVKVEPKRANIDFMCEVVDPDNYDSNDDIIGSVLISFSELKRSKGLSVTSVCFWDFPKSCGIPEIPADNRGYATPRCLPDGMWDSFLNQPLKYCSLPTNDTYIHGNTFSLEDGGIVQYVNAKYFNQTLFAVPYTIEIHSCDDRVVGTRMCNENGDWDGDEYICSG